MTSYPRDDAAERAGVEPSYLVRLVDLGIITPEDDRFSPGDVRRVLMAKSLEDAGIPLEGVAAAIQRGALSLDFLDAAAYERFATLSGETFQQVSDRTGIPLELLTLIREAIGMAQPSPDDRLREDEMAIVPFIELQISEGFRPAGDRAPAPRPGRQHASDRRCGGGLVELGGDRAGCGRGQGPGGDRERRALRSDLTAVRASHARDVPRPAGACLDRQHHRRVRDDDGEGGDPQPPRAGPGDLLPRHHRLHAADPGARRRCGRRSGRDGRAAGAAQLRAVRRETHQVAGRRRDVLLPRPRPRCPCGPRDGGRARRRPGCRRPTSACTRGRSCTSRAITSARPSTSRARIADYARPGEVLVSDAVADASKEQGIAFGEIGQVELKGVSGTVQLLRAHLV